MDSAGTIHRYLDRHREAVAALDVAAIDAIVARIRARIGTRAKVFVFGNGGSAAAAAHFAVDLSHSVRGLSGERLRVLCPTEAPALLTARANDGDFADVFVESLRDHLDPGDLVIALTTSGESENIVRALAHARAEGADTVGILGQAGGRAREHCQVSVVAPLAGTFLAEDLQVVVHHAIVHALRGEGSV
ncbi:MAG: SIS domain-containing protein [Deltaproteobacteria bacterium]|nr:MAG: SIS domain-containing protein [Deltaproteobacteria bacterium]